MNDLGMLGISTGAGIASNLIGNTLGMGYNRKMQQDQLNAQKELGKFNSDLQYDMWLKTNYDAQVKQMEKAGLNVGLMYGSSGGQGGTTGSASAGNVGKGEANNKIEIEKGMGMLLQGEQIKNIKADTAKKEAEKDEVIARTPTYEKGMQKTDNEINEIASRIGVNAEQVKKIVQEIEASKTGQKVQEATIPKIEAEVKNIESQTNRINTLTPLEAESTKQEIKSQITKNVYLDRKERAELENLLQDVLNKRNQIKQTMNDAEIRTFAEEMKADYPSLFNVGGRAVDGIIRGISRILGGQDDKLTRKIEIKRD